MARRQTCATPSILGEELYLLRSHSKWEQGRPVVGVLPEGEAGPMACLALGQGGVGAALALGWPPGALTADRRGLICPGGGGPGG